MNIYTASAKDLQNLKGIGAKLDEKIVNLRLMWHNSNGRFGYEHQYPSANMVRLGS